MKKINVLLVSFMLFSVLFSSCKKEHEKDETVAENPEDDSIEVLEFVSLYPEETQASPAVIDDATSNIEVHTEGKKPSVKNHKVSHGNAFVDKNNDVLGAVIVSTSEQDTLRMHITSSEPVVSTEKVSKRRFKGVAYLNNKEYTFDTPFTVTKTGAALDVEGDVVLTPLGTKVEKSGDVEKSVTTTTSHTIKVKIKQRFDGKKVVKLEDLVTGDKEKLVYDEHGNLIKDKKNGELIED